MSPQTCSAFNEGQIGELLRKKQGISAETAELICAFLVSQIGNTLFLLLEGTCHSDKIHF